MEASRALFVGLSLIGLLIAVDASAAGARDATAKPSPSAAANSTIYIIRQKEFKLLSFAFDTFVDKQKAGELAAGTYLVVRRPPGHHSVTLVGNGWSGGLESNLETVGGRTYFIELGPSGYAPGMQIAQSLTMRGAGLRGTPLPGTGGGAFYLLDEKQGAEQIAGLKNVTR